MHGLAGVESTHESHGDGETETADDGACAPAPFVGEEEGGDGKDNEHNTRHAGGEERGFAAGKTRLLKEEGCVLGVGLEV